MRLIDADELKAKLQEHHDFFVNAYGGFKNLPPNDKARVDEITHCISEVVNAPTVNTDEIYKKGYHNGFFATHDISPTVGYAFYQEAYQTGYEEGKNERPQGEWVPVSERLPEYSGLYLISVDDVVTVANFTGTYFTHRGGGRVEVYAWQSLPEPYKKGGAE